MDKQEDMEEMETASVKSSGTEASRVGGPGVGAKDSEASRLGGGWTRVYIEEVAWRSSGDGRFRRFGSQNHQRWRVYWFGPQNQG